MNRTLAQWAGQARWRGAWGWLWLAALTGCRGEQSMLDTHSPTAQAIEGLWWWMFYGAAAVLVVVMSLAFYAIYRQPERRGAISATKFVLAGGVLLPVAALTPLLVFGLGVGYRAYLIDPEALTVDVIAHRFWWEVRYPGASPGDTLVTSNELRIPAGQQVRVRLHSEDVIHSFWVPSLAGKLDVIPGRVNQLQLQAQTPGIFRGQCAEFCGALHAHMEFYVIALEPEQFQRWRQRQARGGRAPEREALKQGQQAFMAQGCGDCHRIRGSEAQGSGGPDLTHVASRYSLGLGRTGRITVDDFENWIVSKEHLLQPQAEMPAYDQLAPEELRSIALYLESLQ